MTARRPPAPVEASTPDRTDSQFAANPISIRAQLILGAGLVKFPGISTQVLQEFLVNVTRKIPTPLAISDARELIRTYFPWVRVATEPAMVLRATEIAEVWRLSFWDSMIVAGAEASGASLVYSEDLAHGQIISGIRIENPFSPTR